MDKKIAWTLGLGVAVVGSVIAACSGDTGPAGPAGQAGATGPAGSNGTSGTPGATGATGPAGPGFGTTDGGEGGVTGPLVLSARATKGFAIASSLGVSLALDGKSNADLEQIGQGSYLVNAVAGCGDCHNGTDANGKRMYLAGGVEFDLGPTIKVYSRNLTPDPTTGLTITKQAFYDAIRTGKDDLAPTSQLQVMPWQHYRWLTTADLDAIWAYLHVIPAQSNAVKADANKPAVPPVAMPGNYNEGQVARPLPPDTDATGQPIPDAEVQRGIAMRVFDAPKNFETLPIDQQESIGLGAYLVNLAGCGDCHSDRERKQSDGVTIDLNEYLTGGQTFAVPPPLQPVFHETLAMSADLVGATHGFFNEPEDSLGRFLAVITSGTHADESTDGEPARPLGWPMPWFDFKWMETGDLSAIYAYMKSVPANSSNDKVTQNYDVYCGLADGGVGTCPVGTCDPTTHACTGNTCTGSGFTESCSACQTCNATVCTIPGPDAGAASSCPSLGIP